jgi:alkanesulfonate monooxygenase SsuD/methylene tetrahydromethanopterin reductase-like flavin-dependent oxidoreductase (luciferase family)
VYRPQVPPEHLAAAAAAADAAGIDDLWLWEDCFLAGGVSAAAIALANSSRLTVGVGVLPVPMRNVAATAMEIATLARAFPGRLRIGIGHGVLDWMAQIGARVASPMTLLREHLICLPALLRGEQVTFHGRYVHLEGVRLDWPPDHVPQVLAGAMGPKTLALSGETADGTILTGGSTPDQVRAALGHIRRGSQSAARPHTIVTYLLCTTGPDAREQLEHEAAHWDLDPTADIGVAGSAEEIAAGARRWLDAGTDTLVFQPTATAPLDDFLAVIGGDVAPLLRRNRGR